MEDDKLSIEIRKIEIDDRSWIKDVFNKRWGGDFIVSRGKIHKPEELNGFIAQVNNKKKINNNKKIGLITFKVINQEMEIISLDSFLERKGVGTTLLNRAIDFAKKKRIKRIWFITTNDNLLALKFYQRRGFNLARIYPNAMETSRKLKPEIPLIGENGIPLRDEIELEKLL